MIMDTILRAACRADAAAFELLDSACCVVGVVTALMLVFVFFLEVFEDD